MDSTERHIYKVLKKLKKSNTEKFRDFQFKNLVGEDLGNSFDFIKLTMTNKGLIEDAVYMEDNMRTHLISITKLGEQVYGELRNKNTWGIIKEIAFWLLFIASIVSAVYGILSYYKSDDTKNQQLQKKDLLQEQVKEDTYRQSKPSVKYNNNKIVKTSSSKQGSVVTPSNDTSSVKK